MTGLIFASTLSVLTSLSLAAPAVFLDSLLVVNSDTSWLTRTVFTRVDILETATQVSLVRPATTAIESLLLFMPPHVTLSPLVSPSLPHESSISSSHPASGATPSSIIVIKTAVEVSITTVTETPTAITASAAPSTVTDVITVFPSLHPATSVSASASVTTWTSPAQMTDLSAFNISTFAGGVQNLKIVNGIPANASATVMAAIAESTGADSLGSSPPWDNSTSVLRLLYPANSINPGNEPQGGAQFYATPLQLAGAHNISLEYSIFFPAEFNWVLAGKLPGLYGGHKGCSGGDDALTCFSTRLMWRTGGAGELYLYAPKDKQTAALCTDPKSFCDATYGLSIGRGSFSFTAGSWTHVRQTVTLNTPGKQDGGFTLQVNGKEAICRSDVFYRDVPPPPETGGEEQADQPSAAKTPDAESTPASATGGLLGSLLGGILRRYSRRQLDVDDMILAPVPASATLLTTATPTHTRTETSTPSTFTSQNFLDEGPMIAELEDTPSTDAIGFTGLFFSTFFGGHEQQYATPVDQYVWFKDFAMAYNS